MRILNLGRGEPVDLMRFIALIEQAAGRPLQREYTTMQAGDMVETFADTRAARELFGYLPQISLEAGVPPLVAWCREYF
jgi:UDP-glucuronate 4-epimerase